MHMGGCRSGIAQRPGPAKLRSRSRGRSRGLHTSSRVLARHWMSTINASWCAVIALITSVFPSSSVSRMQTFELASSSWALTSASSPDSCLRQHRQDSSQCTFLLCPSPQTLPPGTLLSWKPKPTGGMSLVHHQSAQPFIHCSDGGRAQWRTRPRPARWTRGCCR